MQKHPNGLCVAYGFVVLPRGSRRDTKFQVLFHYCYFASRYDFLMVVDGIGGNWASRKMEEKSQNTFLVWRRAVPETGENSQLCLLSHAWYKEHESCGHHSSSNHWADGQKRKNLMACGPKAQGKILEAQTNRVCDLWVGVGVIGRNHQECSKDKL